MAVNKILTQWVNDYTDEMYSWAYHKVSDAETAKDIVQDSFFAAAKTIDSFQGKSTPKTWLFSILNHKIIDHYRKKTKQVIRVDDGIINELFDSDGGWKSSKKQNDWEEDEINLLDDFNFIKILNLCLEALPEKWNICIQSKYLSNKKGNEICQDLNINPTNFWQIIHRAKLQLRNCIENNWHKE